MHNDVMLEVRDLEMHFDVSSPLLTRIAKRQPKRVLKAVNGLSFTIKKGETFSLVGESGCGKSTVARAVAGLYEPTHGEVDIHGDNDDDPACAGGQKDFSKAVQMIFQDPYASLDPRWRVKDIIAEPIRAYNLATSKDDERAQVRMLLEQVGLSEDDGDKYPHEFSGGQRQRISIARALSSRPRFLICDEPTSALDVSVQAQILNLMADLQEELGLTYLFISHDLAVIDHVSNDIGVMYLGRLCEVTPKSELFSNPRHPYTRLLLETIPDLKNTKNRKPLEGEVPNPINPPTGCSFHPRCPYVTSRCISQSPELKLYGETYVACHAVEAGEF
jgi:peptide/nickel transport system ATP-binding protein